MSRVVYCFTGTGNSLFVAKAIAKSIQAELIVLDHSVLKESISGDYTYFGIVFPVYHQGLPEMVKAFVNRLSQVRCDYVFGVSTYGEKPTLALSYLQKSLSEQNLKMKSGFSVHMPYNYLKPTKIGFGMFNSFTIQLPENHKRIQILTEAEKKIKLITEAIIKKDLCEAEVSDKLIETLVDRLKLRDSLQKKQWLRIVGHDGKSPETFQSAIKLMDVGFEVLNTCSSCGICARVCMADNVKYVATKPEWQHRCEQCMACIHLCPMKAIAFRGKEISEQYHHPNINIEDLYRKEAFHDRCE